MEKSYNRKRKEYRFIKQSKSNPDNKYIDWLSEHVYQVLKEKNFKDEFNLWIPYPYKFYLFKIIEWKFFKESKIDKYDKVTLEIDTLKANLKLSKNQMKVFWWMFFISLIGGVCGIISLIIGLSSHH
ncbi:MAG: hypothetical protein KAV44_10705 [Bacteroidales bacterium]|nr:hypothetical protein [Bacteroidales bacterium]